MKALVLGQGKSGEAAAAELYRRGYAVEFASGYDLVVTSPGVPVKSELQFGCEALRRLGWKLIAITGSKGKSSVVKLIAEALGGVACGNYGRPVSDLIGEKPGWAVVEVSSFQLETTTLAPDTFEAAAVLNLQADHLDRHGGIETYHALKRKLLTFARRGFMPRPATAEDDAILAGSYFDNAVLRDNGAMAIDLMRAAGLDGVSMRRAFRAFQPLPHRFERICDVHGVRCIDDSKATSLAALGAGVRMAGENVRLIAGGLPKGDSPKSVVGDLTKRVKKVYLIGQSAESLFAAWRETVDCTICGTLDRAVKVALREAMKGDTLLLSPGAASFDQFKSYGERGEVFANLVKKEREKK